MPHVTLYLILNRLSRRIKHTPAYGENCSKFESKTFFGTLLGGVQTLPGVVFVSLQKQAILNFLL